MPNEPVPPEHPRPRARPSARPESDAHDPRATSLLTVGEAAERSGATVAALHHYEDIGLLTPLRTSGNQRRYPRHMLRRIALVRMASRVGIPLADIREAMAELPDDRAPNRAEWQRLTGLWRAAIEERIETLQQMRTQFLECIGCGCLSMSRCSIVNPGDKLAPAGHDGPPRRVR